MRYKFFIFNIQYDGFAMRTYYVHSNKDASKLAFDTYDAAEAWIAEERHNGAKHVYQIQKLYVV
jgi:hypothetical protein